MVTWSMPEIKTKVFGIPGRQGWVISAVYSIYTFTRGETSYIQCTYAQSLFEVVAGGKYP